MDPLEQNSPPALEDPPPEALQPDRIRPMLNAPVRTNPVFPVNNLYLVFKMTSFCGVNRWGLENGCSALEPVPAADANRAENAAAVTEHGGVDILIRAS